MNDIILPKLGENIVKTLPKNIKLINIGDTLVFFKYWLGCWRQLSAEEQSSLKKEFNINQ